MVASDSIETLSGSSGDIRMTTDWSHQHLDRDCATFRHIVATVLYVHVINK